jgi:hypothetical protein
VSDRDELAHDPGHHSSGASAPGASGPGEAAYEGAATVGDEGAAAGPESFEDPNGTPPDLVDAADQALKNRLAQDES